MVGGWSGRKREREGGAVLCELKDVWLFEAQRERYTERERESSRSHKPREYRAQSNSHCVVCVMPDKRVCVCSHKDMGHNST